jgi:hypothetical protein
MAIASIAAAEPGGRVKLDKFAIDRTEVTIAQFRKFATDSALKTVAERAGGGHEFENGWIQRPGWTWSAPFGQPGTEDEPAVHVSWNEARDYCAAVGGRLPTLEEWKAAAYTETRANPADDFARGRTYPYPVGDRPDGMNTSSNDRWPRHAAVGTTKRGVNGPDTSVRGAVEGCGLLRGLYRVSLRLRALKRFTTAFGPSSRVASWGLSLGGQPTEGDQGRQSSVTHRARPERGLVHIWPACWIVTAITAPMLPLRHTRLL